MKTLARVAALAAVSLASFGVASAATIGSYGSLVGNGGAATPAGTFINSALTIGGANAYNIGTGGGVWTAPTGGSSWVGANANDCPNCGNVESNGLYTFITTFNATSTSTGSITVMADDTTSVMLNGTLITAAAGTATAGKCTIATPNCTVPVTYTLTGFVSGVNTLTFGVQQIYGNANGVDFSGTVNTAVPEPSSLMLLGTGLVGSAGMFFRRLRA